MAKGHQAAASAATAITSVLLAKRSCAPGLGPVLAVNGIPKSVSSVSINDETAKEQRKDCDLCGSGGLQEQLQLQHNASSDDEDQQQQHNNKQSSGDDSSTGLRENVSNASQAYKVLYMETPLCGCGGSRSGSLARNGRKKKIRNPLEFFQMTSVGGGPMVGPSIGRPSLASAATRSKNSTATRKTRYLSATSATTGTPSATATIPLASAVSSSEIATEPPPSSSAASSTVGTNNKPVVKLNRRNIKAQVKRFRMETKAAKTLGK